MEQIIFDTDPGIDDAMALLLIHSLEALDVVGITTVFGNASIDTCTRNALYMCERFGLSYPVYRGAGRTIEGQDETEFPDFVHGENGLGDIEIGPVNLREQQADAASFIIDASKQMNDLSVLAVGRITNVAAALIQDPDSHAVSIGWSLWVEQCQSQAMCLSGLRRIFLATQKPPTLFSGAESGLIWSRLMQR